MARDIKLPSPIDRERIKAEWANAGLCCAMPRPAEQAEPRPVVRPAEWQPNSRCCP